METGNQREQEIFNYFKEKHDGAEFNSSNCVVKVLHYSEEDLYNFAEQILIGLEIRK